MHLIHPLLAVIGFGSLTLAAGYAFIVLIAVLVWELRRATSPAPRSPAVTLLKPLCGAEPGLYEALRSFCTQNYPHYQIVFGMRELADPALLVVKRLIVEFPTLPIDVVVDVRQHGSNLKISSLINMVPRARHEVLVVSDSDTRVGPDYLKAVTAPLRDRNVGVVTCACYGVPTRGIWSRLGAMYCNEWYMPSVLLTWLFGYEGYVSGQTICIRSATLQAIGGLRVVANYLAEDNRLGELVRGLGLRVFFSPYVPQNEHHEPTLLSLARHELRWMRTLRALRPYSFCLLFLTFSLPLAVVGLVLAEAEPSMSAAAWMLFGITVVARLMLYILHRLRGEQSVFADLWLLPVRDILTCYVWCCSFFTSRVVWRGNEFEVETDGVMRRADSCVTSGAQVRRVGEDNA